MECISAAELFCLIWQDMVRYIMVCYGVVWFGLAWYLSGAYLVSPPLYLTPLYICPPSKPPPPYTSSSRAPPPSSPPSPPSPPPSSPSSTSKGYRVSVGHKQQQDVFLFTIFSLSQIDRYIPVKKSSKKSGQEVFFNFELFAGFLLGWIFPVLDIVVSFWFSSMTVDLSMSVTDIWHFP